MSRKTRSKPEVESKPASKTKRSRTRSKESADGSPAASLKNDVRRYRPGSQLGTYFERLLDQQPHTIEELSAGFNPPMKYPSDPLWYINKHGKEDGTWTIERDKDASTYRLVLTTKGRKTLGI
jgi:hypothetical protein